MNIYQLKTALFTALTLSMLSAYAVPIATHLTTYHSANGTSFNAIYKGDEHLSYLQAVDGTIVVFNKATGNYTVAEYDQVNERLIHSVVNYPIQTFNVGLSMVGESALNVNINKVKASDIHSIRVHNYITKNSNKNMPPLRD